MEPTSVQRKAAFVLVVLVLAGLGAYLVGPSAFGARRAGHAASSPSLARASGRPASSTPVPTTTPAPTGTATDSGGPDIYQWLPFSQSELGAAVKIAKAFSVDYGTYSYSESTASYVAAMQNLISPALSALVARAYAAPGVASLRATQKQVATGTATISSLRAFGATSLTFVVAISQQITDSNGRSKVSVPYAVTVTGGGSSWQVSDIELASAGNP
jgi:hypothetical protein